jgi:hypothetical protein
MCSLLAALFRVFLGECCDCLIFKLKLGGKGMLISKTSMVKWNGKTRKWYEDRGYVYTKHNDLFECKVSDIQPTSTVKVIVTCDYHKDMCKGNVNKEYRKYIEERNVINKDCCGNPLCRNAKLQEVYLKLYGVNNCTKRESAKLHLRNIFKTPFHVVIGAFNNKGLKLISKEHEYNNSQSVLRYVCPNHVEYGAQETTYTNVKKNKYCCPHNELYHISKRKLDVNLVKEEFVKKGLQPVFDNATYKSNMSKLGFICPQHKNKGVQYVAYGHLHINKYLCYYCSKEAMKASMRLKQEFVFDGFIKKGLIPIEGEVYIHKDNPIQYRCIKHPHYIQYATYGGLKNTNVPCDLCRIENSLQKLSRTLRSSISSWKHRSKLNCNNRCIFTHASTYEIHHIITFDYIIKKALNELSIAIKNKYTADEIVQIKRKVEELHFKYPLGVCMNAKIHQLFHKLYSKQSSDDDFYNFQTRMHVGEFDDYLNENNLKRVS